MDPWSLLVVKRINLQDIHRLTEWPDVEVSRREKTDSWVPGPRSQWRDECSLYFQTDTSWLGSSGWEKERKATRTSTSTLLNVHFLVTPSPFSWTLDTLWVCKSMFVVSEWLSERYSKWGRVDFSLSLSLSLSLFLTAVFLLDYSAIGSFIKRLQPQKSISMFTFKRKGKVKQALPKRISSISQEWQAMAQVTRRKWVVGFGPSKRKNSTVRLRGEKRT